MLDCKKEFCSEPVKSDDTAVIKSMCTLFDALTSRLEEVTVAKDGENARADYLEYIEKWFVFAVIWSIGATIEDSSRREFENVLISIEPAMFPHSCSVYDAYVHEEKKQFSPWSDKIPQSKIDRNKSFNQIIVPTVDTTRNRYITNVLLNKNV